jgi:hypothetical protein
MSNNQYNDQIFNNILKNINDIHVSEAQAKSLSFRSGTKVEKEEALESKIVKEIKAPYQMRTINAKMKRMVVSAQRIAAFKKQLKNNNSNIIMADDFDIEDFKVKWMELTNDQRSNRINELVKRQKITKEMQNKMRLLLIQGITNKLLERNSVNYDSGNACIKTISCIQFNQGTDNYYFI